MTWVAYETPSGEARVEHESQVFPDERILNSGEDSGHLREWAAIYNAEVRVKKKTRGRGEQTGLFDE